MSSKGEKNKKEETGDQQEIWKCTEYSVGCKQTKQSESKTNGRRRREGETEGHHYI